MTQQPYFATPAPPKGWYSDPDGSRRLRYWTGSAWSYRIHELPPVSESGVAADEAALLQAEMARRNFEDTVRGKRWLAIGIAVAIIVGISVFSVFYSAAERIAGL